MDGNNSTETNRSMDIDVLMHATKSMRAQFVRRIVYDLECLRNKFIELSTYFQLAGDLYFIAMRSKMFADIPKYPDIEYTVMLSASRGVRCILLFDMNRQNRLRFTISYLLSDE